MREPVLLCSEQFSTCNNMVLWAGKNCSTELYPVISELVMLQYPDTPEIEKPHVEDWHRLARISFRIRKTTPQAQWDYRCTQKLQLSISTEALSISTGEKSMKVGCIEELEEVTNLDILISILPQTILKQNPPPWTSVLVIAIFFKLSATMLQPSHVLWNSVSMSITLVPDVKPRKWL